MYGALLPWVTRAGMLALALASVPAAGAVELRGAGQVVTIATEGGLPAGWTLCKGDCTEAPGVRLALVGPGAGAMHWTAGDAATEGRLAGVRYRAEVSRTAEAVTAVLTSLDPVDGRLLVQRYELSQRTRTLRAQFDAPAGAGVRMTTGPGFVPAPLPGFGAAFSGVEAVRLTEPGQDEIGGEGGQVGVAVRRDEWLGIRSRFWAWVAQPTVDGAAHVELLAPHQPAVSWLAPGGVLGLEFYAGPIDWKDLRVVSPALTQMLFATLWEPLRWLCYGLLFLLAWITSWVNNPGIAIILLSLAAKIILSPLTGVADRWQRDVNRIQGRIQPRIADIRKNFRGEEAHRLTLAVYRDEGVHPLFTLKSLAGFAIQVPMFIAAFDMLADNFALSGARFLWVEDLAAPDRFMALPFVVPFFGGHFNLLPLVMTAFTVLSALTQRDDSLTPELLGKQQRQLYFMAGAFFLLFYTFPAGMVLYWTANNFWHFLKVQLTQWWRRPN
jgi:YidC/Oxa1 family membrane protein insertase